MKSTPSAQNNLLLWFRAHRRELPWRANRDPYRIWISETMLQQTTTTAVIPYFERFIARFPTLKKLAEAPDGDVLAAWAGLGYYSRARNLHKAAKALNQLKSFPQDHKELIEFPGFGPYTSRAVASIAFGQRVGVVDGNVIRILSRYHGEKWEWWKNSLRENIQTLADEWVREWPSHEMNQALMELGRTVCTPKSPSCPLCPLRVSCQALKQNITDQLPLPKPRKAKEIWSWQTQVHIRDGQVRLMKNHVLPFLKGQWLLPGEGRKEKTPPKTFHYRHSITHYDIFVTVKPKVSMVKGDSEYRWVSLQEIHQHVPTSLVHKALHLADGTSRNQRRRVLKQKKENRLGDSLPRKSQRRRGRK